VIDPLTVTADRGELSHLRLPAGPELFRRRAARLGALAPGHAAEDFLTFLARLVEAQSQAWSRVHVVPAGATEIRERPPPAAWREALAAVLAGVDAAPAPAAARAAIERLRDRSAPQLDDLAARVRAGELEDEDAAFAPFVGAALQVVYTAMAARLAPGSVPRTQDGACPVCGSAPVAGVVLPDGGLRYLACSLCGSHWHRTRVQCATCGEGGGLTYFAVDPEHGAVKAEACSHCRSFLKLFYLDRDPHADPFADDVATLALDLRLAGEGYGRGGVSCFWS
jgi:FdhE protein